MITDRREPGVYVSIEDLSYVAANPNVGRSVYCVGVCKKGPHNRIVQVTSQSEFHTTFGKPNFYETSKSHYHMDKAMQYSGRGYYVRLSPDDAIQACALVKQSSSVESELVSEIAHTFTWAASATLVCATDCSAAVNVGDWIFSATEAAADYQYAKQVLTIFVESDGSTTLTLDSAYAGTIGDAQAFKFVPYETVTNTGWDTGLELPDTTADLDTDVVYGFYATGAGAFYNDYKIKGARNVELERMYVDDEGLAKYKYLFMNVAIYRVNDDLTESMIEGPWVVSLTDETPDGIRIRDLSSGQPLYIEDIINDNSKLIHCCVGSAMQDLRSSVSATKTTELRKQIMMILSAGQPAATSFIVSDTTGVQLGSGFDGTTDGQGDSASLPLYNDTTGFVNVDTNIDALAAQAYNCSLTSVDGSIGQMREVTYPVYQPDYILTGEWSAATQNSGRYLADLRQDCIHLGDSTYNTSYTADLDSRLNDVP